MIKLNEKELKEKEKYFYKYMAKGNNATLSEVDANSNVSSKSVATFGAENHKDINKQINIYILGNRIEKLFGKVAKDRFFEELNDDLFYVHDASSNSAGMPYCVAIDANPFIRNGDIPLGGNSKAPKHLASFIGAYVNLIFTIAGQFAGAVADVSLLTYFDYFARKDYGDDYLNTHTELINNFFQQLVYTINAPSGGRGQQSVFYNTSIFDENYYKSLFGDLVLPDFTHPNWESVKKLQKFFMRWFNQERTKALLTFPVITAAGQTKDGVFKDLDFKDFITTEMSEGNSFFIYSSDSCDSLSSCCFSADQEVLVRHETNYYKESFGKLYEISQELGTDIFEVAQGISWNKGKLIKLPNRQMFEVITEDGRKITVSDNHLNPTATRGDVVTTELTTDDWLMTIDYEKPLKIKSIEPVDYDGDIYCFEMIHQEFPYFSLANGIMTHNCRLRNEIPTDKNTFAYTLGGTGLATGSKKVMTLNINRIVQKNIDLEELLENVHKYLVAFDDILYEEFDAGLLPVYKEGYISLDKQYLTVGVNGVVEAAEYLGFDISNNQGYKDWLRTLLSQIKAINKKESKMYSEKFGRKIMYNTEFVPAESLGKRNADKDKADGLKVNRDIYNSYFYRSEDEMDLFDKFDLYSKDILDNLDGGSALHLNLQEIPTKETWEKIVDYATKVGCNYWCYNVKCTCCEEPGCGYINKNTTDHCTKCGSTNVVHATRVIGFLVKLSSMSNARQAEAGLRFYK